MPRTDGDAFVHVSHIDLAVEADIPPYPIRFDPLGDVERRIGEYIADLVADGCTSSAAPRWRSRGWRSSPSLPPPRVASARASSGRCSPAPGW
jgi:hypothetical protein